MISYATGSWLHGALPPHPLPSAHTACDATASTHIGIKNRITLQRAKGKSHDFRRAEGYANIAPWAKEKRLDRRLPALMGL